MCVLGVCAGGAETQRGGARRTPRGIWEWLPAGRSATFPRDQRTFPFSCMGLIQGTRALLQVSGFAVNLTSPQSCNKQPASSPAYVLPRSWRGKRKVGVPALSHVQRDQRRPLFSRTCPAFQPSVLGTFRSVLYFKTDRGRQSQEGLPGSCVWYLLLCWLPCS